jgi:pantoate--beta-alanine ligase
VKSIRTAAELRAELERSASKKIGFVPTMGALHAGHLSLVRAARATNDVVVVSIFVNPLQFGPRDDFAAYPRAEADDTALAETAGADVLFLPSVDEMYPAGRTTTVSAGPIGDVLEGADRPGHFDGVATVVAKLFNLVSPDRAYFGAKDAQQVAVIRRLARDLSFDIELVVGDTVREPDGLALSSRNAYLTAHERSRAPAIYRALRAGAEAVGRGEDIGAVEKNMWELLVSAGLQPSYAHAVDPETFGPPSDGGPVLLVIAAHLGETRLIDNLLFEH